MISAVIVGVFLFAATIFLELVPIAFALLVLKIVAIGARIARWLRPAPARIPVARVVRERRPHCGRCGHTYARELGCCLCTWARFS